MRAIPSKTQHACKDRQCEPAAHRRWRVGQLRLLTGALLRATVVLAFTAAPAHAAARITIVNINAPGQGFNDPTPAAPIGGNTGTTLGEQRLIAFQHAAGIWGAHLDSRAEIFIEAAFVPLPCQGGSAVAGAAGPTAILSVCPGAVFPQTLYPFALANKRALADLWPGPPGSDADDIFAVFSTTIDNPICLGPRSWYYGLDGQPGTDVQLVTVLLHEFAHGLGFASFVDERTGEGPDPDHREGRYSEK